MAKYENIIKKLEGRIDSPDFDIDELERVEQQIAGVKNEGKSDYKTLDIIDQQFADDITDIQVMLGKYKLSFNGFGSEYQDDWKIDSLNNLSFANFKMITQENISIIITGIACYSLKRESTNSYLLNTCKSSIPSPTPIYFTGILN